MNLKEIPDTTLDFKTINTIFQPIYILQLALRLNLLFLVFWFSPFFNFWHFLFLYNLFLFDCWRRFLLHKTHLFEHKFLATIDFLFVLHVLFLPCFLDGSLSTNIHTEMWIIWQKIEILFNFLINKWMNTLHT